MRSGERAKSVLCIVALVMIVGLMAMMLAGCGNVSLQGEAMTAAQQSSQDAATAVQRANADPATPSWLKAYLLEDAKQWRSFVRAANKQSTWGPTLPGEATTQPAGGAQ